MIYLNSKLIRQYKFLNHHLILIRYFRNLKNFQLLSDLIYNNWFMKYFENFFNLIYPLIQAVTTDSDGFQVELWYCFVKQPSFLLALYWLWLNLVHLDNSSFFNGTFGASYTGCTLVGIESTTILLISSSVRIAQLVDSICQIDQ